VLSRVRNGDIDSTDDGEILLFEGGRGEEVEVGWEEERIEARVDAGRGKVGEGKTSQFISSVVVLGKEEEGM